MSCVRLIDAERATFSGPLMCRLLEVSCSGYYGWRDRPLGRRTREDAALTGKIRGIHKRSRGTYSVPRVHTEHGAVGIRCGRKRVVKPRRKATLHGYLRDQRKRTTRGDGTPVPAGSAARLRRRRAR